MHWHREPVCCCSVGLVVIKVEASAGQRVLDMVHNGTLNRVHICVDNSKELDDIAALQEVDGGRAHHWRGRMT